jgi:hypothetical protein
MKKILLNTLIWGFALLGVLSSCSEEETVIPSNTPSVIAFSKNTASVKEGVETVEIEVVWSKFTHIPGEVTLTVAGTGSLKAEENVDYTISTKTLSFAADEYRKSFTITSTAGNNEYTGNKTFTITLASSNVENARLGAVGKSATCVVSIADIDHPLLPLVGNATLSYYSPADDDTYTTNVAFEIDPDDVEILWLTGYGEFLGGAFFGAPQFAKPLKVEVNMITTGEYKLDLRLPQVFWQATSGGDIWSLVLSKLPAVKDDYDTEVSVTDVSILTGTCIVDALGKWSITFDKGFVVAYSMDSGASYDAGEFADDGTVIITKP